MQRVVESPIGLLVVVADERGVTALHWPTSAPSSAVGGDPKGHAGASAVLDRAQRQLDEYFAGTRRSFDLPLHPVGTPFQLGVWEVLRGIDYGTTITYGEQARRLGSPTAVRAVGGANGRNPIGIIVPCHRVVGSDGSLTGFAGGVERKRWLLDFGRANA